MKQDIEGVKAKPPKGFAGVIYTIIAVAAVVFVQYVAGAFSEILP
jgi:hypothetical protein